MRNAKCRNGLPSIIHFENLVVRLIEFVIRKVGVALRDGDILVARKFLC